MHNFRPAFYIIGQLLAALAIGMLLPALLDLLSGNREWFGFFSSAVLTGFVAGILILTCRCKIVHLTVQQAFALTGWSWIALALFAALPLWIGLPQLNYTDSFFEAMSGLTTTGATVIKGLDDTGYGILIWRGLLQWFGGIGIIFMAIAVLPTLNIGGMQLFRIESSDTSEKILPRTREIAGSITRIYVGISLLCAVAYMLGGMGILDAIIHAMTTIATGGFSTSDQSIGGFHSAAIDWIAIIFMIISSIPFAVYLQAMHGNHEPLFRDAQVRTFLAMLLTLILVMWIYRLTQDNLAPLETLREVFFNVTSILTGTGYVTANYDQWGSFSISLFLIISFIGGCAGSTACGLKIFRVHLIALSAIRSFRQLLHPNGVFILTFNNRPIINEVIASVMIFVVTFLACFAIIALLLSLIGLDMITAISASASTIANVGPGLGPIIGPEGNYASLPESAKWILCMAMIMGRLELFAILVMLTPHFWQR